VAGKNPTVLKRDRERARAEKAARKREERDRRKETRGESAGPRVATRQDLDGYGLDRSASGDPFEGSDG
jgi:hypothetical protein